MFKIIYNSIAIFLFSIFKIHRQELKKFLPMALMITLTIFVYSVLRNVKDAVVITQSGAEIISTLKLWGVMPSAVIFMIVYAKLCNVFDKKTLFHIINGFFIGFFILYDLVLVPFSAYIHPDCSALICELPYFKYPLLAVSYWSHTLYYIMSELWGSVMLSLMFWQFANDVTAIPEAKRFYALFGAIGQLGLYFAGVFTKTANSLTSGDGMGAWQTYLHWVTGSVFVAGVVLSLTYIYMQRCVLTDPRYMKPAAEGAAPKKKKEKLSVSESLKYIFSSKYLGLIAMLVLCYGISINLVEGVWKSQVKLQYPTKETYSMFFSQFQIYSSIFNIILMFIGSIFLRVFSWRINASLTPLVILVTGVMFFIFITFNAAIEPMFAALGASTLMLAIYIGGAQNIISKGVKYSLFDGTKEIAYIPLDPELKSKGKAAVDVTGGRMGKSGGAFIQFLLLSIFPNVGGLVGLTPAIFVIFTVIMLLWLYSVFALNKEFTALSHKKASASNE